MTPEPMTAEKAKKIIEEIERNAGPAALAVIRQENITDEYKAARVYLAALQGPEVKALVEAAKLFENLPCECRRNAVFATSCDRCILRDALKHFTPEPKGEVK